MSRHRRQILAAIAGILAWGLAVGAHGADYTTAAEFLKAYDLGDPARDEALAMARGELDAYGWANADLTQTRHEPPIFCAPPHLAITSDQAIQILRTAIGEHPEARNQQYGLVLIHALISVFPCP